MREFRLVEPCRRTTEAGEVERRDQRGVVDRLDRVAGAEPREQGANAASLQVSDGLGSILLIGAAGAIFAAYAGSATDPTGAGGVGATPYVVIDLVMALVCLAGALAVFVLLVAAAVGMYLRSRRTPVDHNNVNDEWDSAPAQDREPAGVAG